MTWKRWGLVALELALASLTTAYLLYIYPWDDLLRASITAGGDMASHYYPAWFMHTELLPRGQIIGWTMGNYAGFAIFHFYSTLPFFLIAALGYVFPMEQTFKLVTLLGPTTLPLAAAYFFHALGYRRGATLLASCSVLPLLYQQGNSMWGGNLASVLAGEFCHSIGISLSLVFLGLLHRTANEQGSSRAWIPTAFLFAAVGLSHAFAFLAAAWSALYYIWPRRRCAQYARWAIPSFALAFLLLCFWGLLLPTRVQYTTEYSPIWRISDWKDVLPELLWPAAVLAMANLLLMVPRPAVTPIRWQGAPLRGITGVLLGLAAWWLYRSSTAPITGQALTGVAVAGVLGTLLVASSLPQKRFETERAGFFLFTLFGAGFLYLVVPALGFPDIRFVPLAQMFLGFLAADLLDWIGARVRHRLLYGTVVILATISWSHQHIGYLPSWLTWNYAGYEGKVTWNLFKEINDHIRGDVNSPRAVFEHSQQHNRFGSSRAFENLPFFSGRSTLEGVFHQVSLNSPFIFYIQSEVSERTSGPFPQYSYMRLNPDAALPHLRLYNVSTIVAVSQAARTAYDAHPAFERTLSSGGYAVYELREKPTGYVVAAMNRPVLYDGPQHKLAFFRWFKHPELLDIPLVPAEIIGEKVAREFTLRTDSVTRVPREPYAEPCEVTARMEHERVQFHTECPGRPHIIKVSYFPRWKARDGSPVVPVAPGFMLVTPTSADFELYYGRTALDWSALALSWLGVLWSLACLVSDRANRASIDAFSAIAGPLFRSVEENRTLLSITLFAALAIVGLVIRFAETRPDDLHREAQEAYRDRAFELAVKRLEAWTADDKDTFKQATALYQLGVSYTELGNAAAAIEVHERLRFDFPNIDYVAGSLFHLAKNYAALGLDEKARTAADQLAREQKDTNWLTRLQREVPRLFPAAPAQGQPPAATGGAAGPPSEAPKDAPAGALP